MKCLMSFLVALAVGISKILIALYIVSSSFAAYALQERSESCFYTVVSDPVSTAVNVKAHFDYNWCGIEPLGLLSIQ